MKNLLPLLALALLLGFGANLIAQSELSKEDRKAASTSLKNSQADLFKAVKGLSDEQLNYKPSPESWSVAECMEHLALSEKSLFGAVEQSLQAEADPSQRAELKFTDEEVTQFIEDRSGKVKTQERLEPKNNFGSYSGSVEEFKELRKKNIKYVMKTEDDLRNHFLDFPFGKVDAYQVILFMSGHTVRHTRQIEEILADQSFPES